LIKEEIKSIDNSPAALHKFGMAVGMVLVIIGSVMFWFDTPGFIYFTLTGTFLVFSALVFPKVLKPLNQAWMTLAILLGFVMTRVILMFLYYFILTPVAFLARATGQKFIEKGFDKKKETYWNYREQKEFQKVDYERQF
jgi:hypothetical protein